MPYSELEDLKKQISEETVLQLTDDEGTGEIDEDIVDEAIAKADSLIDSYCGQVATVPFTTVPAVIKQHSVTIAVYYLYSRRAVAPELVRDNYKYALRHLDAIATGKAALPPTTAADYQEDVKVSSEERIFTRDKLKGF